MKEDLPDNSEQLLKDKWREKVESVWDAFFNGKAEIDSDEKRAAWKKTGLNPSRVGGNQSETDRAWANEWHDISSTEFQIEERERERAKITYTANVDGQTTNVDLLRHKKNQVDKVFEILRSIAAEDSIEKIGEIKKKIKKLIDVELPEET